MAGEALSFKQAHALLDILTHAETCAEIEKFKHVGAIRGYGPPFSSAHAPSTSPILQTLLLRFVVTLPGLRDVPESFWKQKIQALVDKFGEADLSDSYDKGGVGARRTLGTAFATLFEYPARGIFGGWRKDETKRPADDYDVSSPKDVVQGWQDLLQDVIYGESIDALFDRVAETGKLEEHSNLVQAAHEYMLLNIAAILHYTMVLSPDGQYLARVISNVHMLVPYQIIAQTLRVGNAATMTNAMVRLILTKLSVTGLTNWIGLTNNANDGMNLMQRIISQVIGWDIADFRKQLDLVTKKKGAPSKQHLAAIKEYVYCVDRTKQEVHRQTSIIESKSIIAVILSSANLAPQSEAQHAVSLEYLSVLSSIRDRREINHLLCEHVPDLITQMMKDAVAAYDPIIRGIHQAADLSGGLTDFQAFLDDFVKLAKKPYSGSGKRHFRSAAGVGLSPAASDAEGSGTNDGRDLPSVEDYVKLVRKHLPMAHKFLHQLAKNGGSVVDQYRDWFKLAVSNFRHPSSETSSKSQGAGLLTEDLNNIFKILPEDDQAKVRGALDAHATYLATLSEASDLRMKNIMSNKTSTCLGPGIYLSRWQDLLDQTPLTPLTPQGPVRYGSYATVKAQTGVGSAADAGGLNLNGAQGKHGLREVGAPNVTVVLKAMGEGFREILRVRAMDSTLGQAVDE